ncbi:S8 family serine peptidase [Legionella sp. MW5194]|uniref:S8 family serine peptidase n=1 Tax=Legionella sp. MW5194 TaxID=2662448 RepID=UPI00193DD382|nr:S8 family serine peptidase [Legionella sp. MW5194]QRN04505.1 S8 family serine peptidase [Legionella sp. MW5194]
MRYQTGLIGCTLLALAQGACALPETHDVRVIIKYKHPMVLTSLQKQLTQQLHVPVKTLTPMANGAYVLSIPASELKQALSQGDATDWVLATLRHNPEIQYAVKDRVGHFKPMNQSTDSDYIPLSHELQWDEFSAPAGVMLESAAGKRDGAWAYTTGEAHFPVVVAVLDTGVALNPSLVDNLTKDEGGGVWGWNFAGNNRDVRDETRSYHGTHVAGTIAAYGEVMNGIGVHLKVLPVKIPDASGMFYESQVVNAIYWSVGGDVPGVPHNPYPAKVLNMSFGVDEGPGKEIDHCDEALQEALAFARKQGAVVAAAAGNDNRWEHYNAPAVCNHTMKVASTGPEGLRAYYSNYGPGITYAAPGGDARYGKTGSILSTVNPGGGYQGSGFDFYQGTSMASPHAAGIAALIYAVKNSDITPEQVEQLLFTTTHAFGESRDANKSCVGKKPCGHGILDAHQAIKAALANYDVVFTAPAGQNLGLVSCAGGALQAQQKTLTTAKAHWQQLEAACQDEGNYQLPRVEQNGEQIVAVYGKTRYQLDKSSFKRCEVIGFDGVGCYF